MYTHQQYQWRKLAGKAYGPICFTVTFYSAVSLFKAVQNSFEKKESLSRNPAGCKLN